jgi:hypothetical protein
MEKHGMMTQQNPKIDGRTKRALDMAIARKQVSRGSYRAVLAGTLTLQEAKAIGRDGGPATDAAQGISGPGRGRETAETPQEQPTDAPQGTPRSCLCGCGETTRGGRFKPGHDARLYGELKRNLEKDPLLRNERFTEEQRGYARERGLLDG